MNRRHLLSLPLAGLAASPVRLPAENRPAPLPVVDTQVWLGQHPWRNLPELSFPAESGVTEAWAGSFESWLHRDLDGVNARLAERCHRFLGPVRLRAFGAVDPTRSGWQETLRRCAKDHAMPGLRLLPGPHGYDLEHPALIECLSAAAEARLLVQLAIRLEDARTLAQVSWKEVSPAPLPALMRPALRVQLLNALPTIGDRLLQKRLVEAGIRFDHAMLEGIAGVAQFEEKLPGALLFGSYAPFFIAESAHLKLVESALPDTTMNDLCWRRAEAWSSHLP